MCGWSAIDLAHGPRLRWIGAVRQDRDVARTLIGTRRESGCDRDLRNAVAVDIGRGNVDQAGHSSGEDVASPRRILEPDELRQIAGDGDEIRLAIAVEIRGHDLVPTAQTGRDLVRDETRRRRC
jgi:hypothetical protein